MLTIYEKCATGLWIMFISSSVTSFSTTGSTGFGSGFLFASRTDMMEAGMWACCYTEKRRLLVHKEIPREVEFFDCKWGSVNLETGLTWWGVKEWTCCRRGSLISGQRSNTLVSCAGGSCRSTLNDWGFVLWQHFTNPSHTLGYFHTYKGKNSQY